MVLLPGLGSTYRGYAPSLLRLAPRFRTVQIDYPGDNPGDGANLIAIRHSDILDDLFGLLDHLRVDQAYPFGLSFGSTITLQALHLAPERFPKAALQGGFARRRLMPPERLALALGRHFPGQVANLPFHRQALALKNRSTFPADVPDRWDHFVEENGITLISSLVHRLELLDQIDLRGILPEIATEVLVIHGTSDEIVPMAAHRELVAGLARPTAFLMPGVGHQPHWTHPVELARLIGDFFSNK